MSPVTPQVRPSCYGNTLKPGGPGSGSGSAETQQPPLEAESGRARQAACWPPAPLLCSFILSPETPAASQAFVTRSLTLASPPPSFPSGVSLRRRNELQTEVSEDLLLRRRSQIRLLRGGGQNSATSELQPPPPPLGEPESRTWRWSYRAWLLRVMAFLCVAHRRSSLSNSWRNQNRVRPAGPAATQQIQMS